MIFQLGGGGSGPCPLRIRACRSRSLFHNSFNKCNSTHVKSSLFHTIIFILSRYMQISINQHVLAERNRTHKGYFRFTIMDSTCTTLICAFMVSIQSWLMRFIKVFSLKIAFISEIYPGIVKLQTVMVN